MSVVLDTATPRTIVLSSVKAAFLIMSELEMFWTAAARTSAETSFEKMVERIGPLSFSTAVLRTRASASLVAMPTSVRSSDIFSTAACRTRGSESASAIVFSKERLSNFLTARYRITGSESPVAMDRRVFRLVMRSTAVLRISRCASLATKSASDFWLVMCRRVALLTRLSELVLTILSSIC